jgi:DNA-binding GntR family transcriptional regulator
MQPISGLPMVHDMDADYSPQYVKLARILRGNIESGQCRHGSRLAAIALAAEHEVSVRVASHALEMLEANRYVQRPPNTGPYTVTWLATP